MEVSKLKSPWTYVAIGILVAAPIFYALGYSIAQSGAQHTLQQLQARYELANKALNAEAARNRELEARNIYLETTIKKLTKILDTVYGSVKGVRVQGKEGNVEVDAQALYLVNPDFCIDVRLKNDSPLQQTFSIGVSGSGVNGTSEKTTLYGGEERDMQVCGSLTDIAASAAVTIDGKPVVRTVLVAE